MSDGNEMCFVHDVKREVILAVVSSRVRLVSDNTGKWNDVMVDFTQADDRAVAEHVHEAGFLKRSIHRQLQNAQIWDCFVNGYVRALTCFVFHVILNDQSHRRTVFI